MFISRRMIPLICLLTMFSDLRTIFVWESLEIEIIDHVQFLPKQLAHLNKVSGLFDVCASLWWSIICCRGAVRTEAAIVSPKPAV